MCIATGNLLDVLIAAGAAIHLFRGCTPPRSKSIRERLARSCRRSASDNDSKTLETVWVRDMLWQERLYLLGIYRCFGSSYRAAE